VSDLGQVVGLTLSLALWTTALLLLIATPLAYALARARGWWREIVIAITALPIVLPPTVLGFYLLIALGPNSPLMAPLQMLGVRTLAFTFEGLVIGSIFYSLPFAVQPLLNAFEAIGERPMEAAATLRATPRDAFFSVALPMARRGFLAAAILTFAHTIGEFGVVLMIGGAIPGETNVLSIEIYKLVESLEWERAHMLAGGLVIFSFLTLASLLLVQRRWRVAPT
jgi:molybdate transport system permease protein